MLFGLIKSAKDAEINELKEDIKALNQFSSGLQVIDEKYYNLFNSTVLKDSTAFDDDVLIQMWTEIPEISTVISEITNRAKTVPWKQYRIKDAAKFEKSKKMFNAYLNEKIQLGEVLKLQNESLEPVFDPKVEAFLQNPNDLQSWSEWIEMLLNYYFVVGNGYLIKSGAFGMFPDEVTVMASQNTDVKIKDEYLKDPYKLNRDESIIKHYTFENGYGKKFTYDPYLIMHMKTPNLLYKNGAWVKGFSPLGMAIMASKTLKHEYLSRLSLIRDRGMMGMLVGDPKGGVPPTPEDTGKVYKRLQKFGLGDGKKNAFGATNGSYKWLNMSFNSAELELLKGREENLKVLARKFKVPTDLLIGDAIYNNVTSAGKMIYTSSVIPILKDLGSKLNPFLHLPKNNIVLPVYDGVAELQQDMKSQTEIMVAQYDAGIATRDEARVGVGRSKEADSDNYKTNQSEEN